MYCTRKEYTEILEKSKKSRLHRMLLNSCKNNSWKASEITFLFLAIGKISQELAHLIAFYKDDIFPFLRSSLNVP
jgi:hypothetical protein